MDNNDIQLKLTELTKKGWTLAAIADELGITPLAVELWKAGKRYPTNAKSVSLMLDKILEVKRIPKKRRYVKGSRRIADSTTFDTTP
jgi:predicted transcriptional regulator